ncbi:hypothetical protein GQX73_g8060 [Xylaria multiplex]|uniref:AB hydrolase-1 domain-containing protein n=1 Tax=Xylaria multiplex TaxID=323545 RepID=A0A7C8MQI7_9PEZI|nr:hypothetical protein GQX73_g8060 [Xylaria multiplex]
MKRLMNSLILLAGLGCKADSWQDPGMAYGFDNIEPSADLTWTPCFDDFACSLLEVPLDYSNRRLGTTSIAFIKLAGKNATAESPSIVIIPGGPGGSGVGLLLAYQTLVGQIFGEQYNFVSFDPRGVNNSGLGLDCFSGNVEARSTFTQLYSTGATNISSTSLEEQYYSSSIYGEWCNNAVENESYGYYVTTPAVAHDLLTFIEAEAEVAGQPPSDAKLWCYGVSYGTAIGATFASIFPDRVGRMILDGIMNAEQYYDNDWRDNVDQVDEAMDKFSSFCHSAGPELIDDIIYQLQHHPVPLSRVQSQDLPTLVTYSDLKTLFANTLYTPLASFPAMADTLHQLEHGDVSALAGTFGRLGASADAGRVIRCADSYRRNKLTTIEEFQSYVEYTVSKSKYIGDIWPIYAETLLYPIGGLNKTTSFPILFASNTIDPITPLKSARKMSSQFPGSVLLLQEAVGPYADTTQPYTVPRSEYSVRSETAFAGLASTSSGGFLNLLATKFVDFIGQRDQGSTFRLEAEEGRIYTLDNPDDLFNNILTSEEHGEQMKRWLERWKRRGLAPRFVVGYRTFVNSKLVHAEHESYCGGGSMGAPVGMAYGDLSDMADVNITAAHKAAREAQSWATLPGERIYAIAYRKIRVKTRKGIFTGATTDVKTKWESFSSERARGENEPMHFEADVSAADDDEDCKLFIVSSQSRENRETVQIGVLDEDNLSEDEDMDTNAGE